MTRYYRIDDDADLWRLARDIVAQRRRRKMANETEAAAATELKTQLEGEARAKGVPQAQIDAALGSNLQKGIGTKGIGTKGIGTSPSEPHERMLRFFRYEHLRPELQGASKPFCELARWLCATQGPSPERTKSLNALVEAKDWAVRALVPE